MKNIVYKIINKTDGKFYFGSTKNLEKRIDVHFNPLSGSERQHNNLHKDIEKLGKENFIVEIVCETSDDIEAARIEGAMIRDNTDNVLCYNIANGSSGRRVFYDSEIIFIRKLYEMCEMIGSEVYEKYFYDKVTPRAFSKVWNGETFKDIYYHVYTEDNKSYHASKSRSLAGAKNGMAILTEEDVRNIRQKRKDGLSRIDVYEEYSNLLTRGSFECVWYYSNWKHITL